MNYLHRHLETELRTGVSTGKVRLLFGARQTGKSTLLRQLTGDGAVFVNLQERRTRLQMERDPRVLTQMLEADPRERLTVCVDEVQKVPGILDEVQYLFDRSPGRYDFFLTGSSARRLKTSSANLLPGRSHLFHLCPLVLTERQTDCRPMILPFELHADGGRNRFPRATLDELLLFGNLPGVSMESVESRKRTLSAYVELYLEEEIRREALVRNVGAFQQFLELAALESGRTVHLTNLSKESGVPAATLNGFYQVLEDTFVGYRIPAFGAAGRKRVLTTPRFLFFDTGVRNAAARLRFTGDALKTQFGLLFENWVGLELLHRCLYAGRSHRLSFWRTVHGAEVDYVVETPDEVVPVEVKTTESPAESDARHINLFIDTYPDRARRGYVVCRCSEPRRLTDRVEAVPWERI
jgi:predicted AAA+ superfamily ATPase